MPTRGRPGHRHAPARPGAYPAPRGARGARGKRVAEVEGPRLRMVGALGPRIGKPRGAAVPSDHGHRARPGEFLSSDSYRRPSRHRRRRPIRPTRATSGEALDVSDETELHAKSSQPAPPSRGKSSVIRPSAVAYPESTGPNPAITWVPLQESGRSGQPTGSSSASRGCEASTRGRRVRPRPPGRRGARPERPGSRRTRDRRRDVTPRASRSLGLRRCNP